MQPYLTKEPTGVQWMVDGKPFLVLGGEVHNSSASSLSYMEPIWEKLRDLGLNTVLAPIYWELIEPEERKFDFALLDGLMEGARSHGLRLILLWFATWKNTLSHYVPEWVKTDFARFPRALSADGRILPSVSCLSEECRRLDARAFAQVMAHIRETDRDHTVIGMQVENETGLLDSPRDYRPEATALFESPVPEELAAFLREREGALSPALAQYLRPEGLSGNWREAFGLLAEEAFMAYHTARYVGAVAAAGKAEYDIPMFVNAWPAQCPGEPGGVHPSGGPVSAMHDIWRCAAPALDALAADLYLENFAEECAAYTRLPGNPLVIPEGRPDRWFMAHAFYAIAEHGALCYSPFGIEDVGHIQAPPPDAVIQSVFQTFEGRDTSALIRGTYGILRGMSRLICANRGTGKMHGILQGRLMNQMVELSGYYAHISFANFVDRMEIPAGGMILELGENDFLLAGAGYSVRLVPKPETPPHFEYLSIEEGSFVDGQWVRRRRLNGDELHPVLPAEPTLLRVRLFGYR